MSCCRCIVILCMASLRMFIVTQQVCVHMLGPTACVKSHYAHDVCTSRHSKCMRSDSKSHTVYLSLRSDPVPSSWTPTPLCPDPMTSSRPPFIHPYADEEAGSDGPWATCHSGQCWPPVSTHHPAWDNVTKKLCLLGQGCPCTPCPVDLGGVVTGTPPKQKACPHRAPHPGVALLCAQHSSHPGWERW